MVEWMVSMMEPLMAEYWAVKMEYWKVGWRDWYWVANLVELKE